MVFFCHLKKYRMLLMQQQSTDESNTNIREILNKVRDHLFVIISFARHRLKFISNKTCFNCRRNRLDTHIYM